MREKAEKLAVLFTELIENSYRDEKSACENTPLCSLSSNDLKVLTALSSKNHPSIKDISEELSLPMSTLTGIFNKLVQKKLVTRDRCESDRRVVRVELTSDGQKAAELKQTHTHNFAASILNSLNENEQIQFLNLLQKITANQ